MSVTTSPAATGEQGTTRATGKTILFVMLHDGFVKIYESALRPLASQGHRIHVVHQSARREQSVRELWQRLVRDCPGVSVEPAPELEETRWTSFTRGTRLLIDYLRFFDHRYDGSDVLRRRVDRSVLPPRLRPLAWPLRHLGDRGIGATLRLLQRLERAIPPNSRVVELLEELRPDLVLVTPLVDFGSEQPDYVKAARALGIPSVLCVASWDNLTIKGHMRVVPDRIVAWNEAQRDEAVALHGADPDQVVTTGAQTFDHGFDWRPARDRAEFCGMVGLDPKRPFVLFLGSSYWMAPAEAHFVERWIRRIRSADDPALASAGILIRPHPGSALRYATLDVSQVDNVAVWPLPQGSPKRDTYAEFSQSQRNDLFDSLYHSVAAVGANTSALIEAGIVGRPVCTLNVPEFENAQGTIHFAHLAGGEGGLLRVADDFDTHLRQLGEFVAGDGVDEGRLRAFIQAFVRPHGLEQPAAPILVRAIEEAAELRVEPVAQTFGDRVLRTMIAPLAVLSSRLFPEPAGTRPGWFWPVRPLLWVWLRLVVARAYAVSWVERLGGALRRRFRALARPAAR